MNANSMDLKERLLPCPFCGAKATLNYEMYDIADWSVQCVCGATCGGWSYNKKEAIKAWNTRHKHVGDVWKDNCRMCYGKGVIYAIIEHDGITHPGTSYPCPSCKGTGKEPDYKCFCKTNPSSTQETAGEDRKIECTGEWHTLSYEEYVKKHNGCFPRSCPVCHNFFNPTPKSAGEDKSSEEHLKKLVEELYGEEKKLVPLDEKEIDLILNAQCKNCQGYGYTYKKGLMANHCDCNYHKRVKICATFGKPATLSEEDIKRILAKHTDIDEVTCHAEAAQAIKAALDKEK